jgi:hypothetical protein
VPVQGAELYDIARRHGIVGEDFYPSDDWDIFEHLPDTSKRTFNRHYAKARRLQMLMALRSGHLEWRNWTGISHKFMTMVWGKTDSKTRRRDEESLWATPLAGSVVHGEPAAKS